MPARGIQHVDLAVSDVDRSLAFYKNLLGPLGLEEEERYPTIEVFSPGPPVRSKIFVTSDQDHLQRHPRPGWKLPHRETAA